MTPAILLRVVATPIGNLGDISARAIEELTAAEVIACEDTRRTGALLRHLGIPRRTLVVVNDHTERGAVARLVERMERGDRVALVSDAGMPAISDPGWLVVNAVLDAGGDIDVIPGPSAAIVALVASGLATNRYCFEGFLPRKGAERQQRLAELAIERRTSVLYEAPHRVARTLADLAEVCGALRQVAVARELTKLHQQIWRGTVGDAVEWAEASEPRGEIVVVLDGAAAPAEVTDAMIVDALDDEIGAGSTRRDAIDSVVSGLGVARRRVYRLALDEAERPDLDG